jgi:hypothetical protein
MPSAKLPLNDAEGAAFDFLAGLVRRSVAARATAAVVLTPDAADWDKPPLKTRVLVKLRPSRGRPERVACRGWGLTVTRTPLVIDCEFSVPGVLWANLADLGDALADALCGGSLSPADAVARWRALDAVGVADVELAESDAPAGPDAPGKVRVVANLYQAT